MKPISLYITQGGDAIVPHIVIPLQTTSSITLEDDRKLFLPARYDTENLVVPTQDGKWVISGSVATQTVKDESRTLPYDYVEIWPDATPGFLVFLHAVLPSFASITLTEGTKQRPIRWLHPKKSVTTGGVQKITGLFEVPEDGILQYIIFPRDADLDYTTIGLAEHLVEIP